MEITRGYDVDNRIRYKHRDTRYKPIDMPEVKDKDGKVIHEGDTVSGKARGGKQAGTVEAVVITAEEAKAHHVKHPPKVIIKDQHGTSPGDSNGRSSR